ncbi:MAG: DivIVA domain-containing protein [Deltaproteobacteria bacterium]|nr:DivIVA domain-containing protein [Deltaproteobacteria bacterium]
MAMTPLELKEYDLKSSMLGYDKKDVEALRDVAIEALTDSLKKIDTLSGDIKELKGKLFGHEQRENMLKDTITTAQKMVNDLKGNANKEAELIVAEARHQSDQILQQAQRRALEIQQEIQTLKKQRVEFETKLKALLDYHSSILNIEKTNSNSLDQEADKLQYLTKK